MAVPLPVDECEFHAKLIGNSSDSFGTPSIRTDDDGISPVWYLAFDIRDHQWLRPQIVHRDIKESLNLTRMEVHRNNVIAPSNRQHIRHELRRDGRPRLVLLVHPCIGEARDDSRYPPCRGGFARRDENEQFHEVVVDIPGARLQDKDVLVTDGFENPHVYFAV